MEDKHCCEDINFYLRENKVSIGFSERFRAYYIDLKGTGGCQNIFYCPWCGTKLPGVLYKEYDDYLSKVLEITPEEITFEIYTDKNIPNEFQTDEWWKKRGL